MCKWPYLRVGLNILWGNSSFNNSFYTGHFLSNILGYRGVSLSRRAVGGCWKRDHCKHCIQKSEATCKVTCLVATLTVKLECIDTRTPAKTFRCGEAQCSIRPQWGQWIYQFYATFSTLLKCFVNACLHKNFKTLAPLQILCPVDRNDSWIVVKTCYLKSQWESLALFLWTKFYDECQLL